MPLVDAYIESFPEQQRLLMQYLRSLILKTVPQVEETFSFKVPFYKYHGAFCYLTPDGDGVAFSFCRGKDLVEAFPQLQEKGRAVVASVTVHETKDIVRFELVEVITAAAQWNEEAKRLKIPSFRRKV